MILFTLHQLGDLLESVERTARSLSGCFRLAKTGVCKEDSITLYIQKHSSFARPSGVIHSNQKSKKATLFSVDHLMGYHELELEVSAFIEKIRACSH